MNTSKFTSLFEFVLCSVVLVSWSYCICQQRGEMQFVSVATVSCPSFSIRIRTFLIFFEIYLP